MRSLHLGLFRILGPALALAASACWVPLEQGDLMESRLDKLEASDDAKARRLDELQRRIDEQDRVVKDRVAAVDRKIVEAQQKIDELNQAARRSGADLGVSVSRLQDEVAQAKGDLEVQQHKLGQLEAQLAESQQSSEKRFAALRGRGALDEAEAKQLLESLPRQDDKAGLLALAQGQEQKGNAGVARQLYEEYLRRFPSDPGAADAAVRSGDLAAGQGRWKEAFIGYGWVYKNAPQVGARARRHARHGHLDDGAGRAARRRPGDAEGDRPEVPEERRRGEGQGQARRAGAAQEAGQEAGRHAQAGRREVALTQLGRPSLFSRDPG